MESYSIPSHVTNWLKDNGYFVANTDMIAHINEWYSWLRGTAKFYESTGKIGKRRTKVKRMSVRPAKRVCNEWASLLLNEDVQITTDSETTNKWLEEYLERIGFVTKGQMLISRAFAMGTAAWVMWFKLGTQPKMQVRRYDARTILPLTYDDDGITECAFVTQAILDGKKVDQLQLHLLQEGTYHILTRLWLDGKPYEHEDIVADFDTNSSSQTFAIFSPAIDNTTVDYSPYGQSVYADAIDAIQAVDLAWDATQNDLKLSKMRIFMSDLLLDSELDDQGKVRYLPFGDDDVIFRRVASTEDLIKVFAPQLRTEAQLKAYRSNWQTLGDLCELGLDRFDVDEHGGIRTATEVASDNSQLMQNIRKHKNALAKSLRIIIRAILAGAVAVLGEPESLANVKTIDINFDDSIITDTQAEKKQDLSEVDRTMNAWEYRMKWYGETEKEAKANVPRLMPSFDIQE